ncbi:hypothetical protein QJS10_CPA02g01484 [Acorus calamus]|uniref:Uncharacterized protein n=1 Tax=Acorus calamus TaxID=4465 RepID=A0AAV9F9N1_ACOCL|nr:hypothetical protein QJS10_CPA02g01484 [Acorus calamus]
MGDRTTVDEDKYMMRGSNINKGLVTWNPQETAVVELLGIPSGLAGCPLRCLKPEILAGA